MSVPCLQPMLVCLRNGFRLPAARKYLIRFQELSTPTTDSRSGFQKRCSLIYRFLKYKPIRKYIFPCALLYHRCYDERRSYSDSGVKRKYILAPSTFGPPSGFNIILVLELPDIGQNNPPLYRLAEENPSLSSTTQIGKYHRMPFVVCVTKPVSTIPPLITEGELSSPELWYALSDLQSSFLVSF